jgi:adenine phosphoribosyltransferase
MNLKPFITAVPDFPKQGILFRDMGPLLANPDAFAETIRQMKTYWENKGITKLGAFDARGFIFAAALAHEMKLPFFMLRKKGKLPGKTVAVSYGLEYGSDVIEMQEAAVDQHDVVLLVDDVLATGGTAKAGAELIEKCGGKVIGLATVMELCFLDGRSVFGRDVQALITYNEHDA